VKRILIVDDDALILDLVAQALQGYEMLLARDGDEALRLATPGTQIDLLITDYLMPTMTGDELIGRIRERRPSLKTLVITGHSDVLQQEMRGWWQVQPHLPKPFTIAALRDAVCHLIGHSPRSS
jgi:CheY-like chemotaxis protein